MFLHRLVEMGGMTLNHHWHGINVLSILECCLLGAVLFTLLALFSGRVRRSKRLRAATVASAMLLATAAYAANTALSNLSAASSLSGANIIYVVQTTGVGGVKATLTQVATFINSLFSGDFTCASGGACTVTKINGVTPPSPIGSVTSVGTSCGVSGGSITSTGTISGGDFDNPISATSYTILNADCGKTDRFTGATAAITVPASTGFAASYTVDIKCEASATCVLTPSSTTINGSASTINVAVGNSLTLYLDTAGTPVWHTKPGNGPIVGTAAAQNTGTSGANVPLLNGNNTESGNNTHTGSETFGEVIGGGRTVSGTTDTLAMTDCGTTVYYSNAGAVTVTIPATLTAFCTIAIMQTGAGKVSVNGTAVSAATLHTAVASGAAVGTRAQYSVINVVVYQTGVANLVGDGA